MFETQTLYRREDLIDKLKVDTTTFSAWEERGLIAPVRGKGSDESYFTEDALERAEHIKQFLELGYDLDGVQKILRKVGLPTRGRSGGTDLERDLLTVGELSDRTGLGARTLKHWEEKGIIEPDGRSEGGFRLYSELTVEVCRLVRDLQIFGYSLEEIHSIADLLREFVDRKGATALQTDDVERIERLQQFLATLQERIGGIKDGISRWESLIRKRTRELKAMQKNRNSNGAAENRTAKMEGNDA
ncbi:MerR family transcriptional regulator [bacterium]|nr:MerR family transcriptional regulator [bacterium]